MRGLFLHQGQLLMRRLSIISSANEVLDIGFEAAAGPTLNSIVSMATAPTAEIQLALVELEEEAKRLDELGLMMEADNAVLQKVLILLGIVFISAGALINKNAGNIQGSGQSVAPVAVTAKIFGQVTGTTGNPVSPDKLAGYMAKLDALGVGWNAPTALDFASDYVNSVAWNARMARWGEGYSDLIKNTILDGIQKGWGAKYTAGKLRQYVETIPSSAAENLTRTLQLTAYRDACLAMESINGGFIIEKVRIATLDKKTCLSCVALHGTVLQKGERIDDHYRGRCSEFYRVPGGDLFPSMMQADSTAGKRKFVKFQNGEDWFASLSRERQAEQRSMASSPAKLRAYLAGHSLSEFIGEYSDPVFGRQTVENSLMGAIGELAEQYYSRSRLGRL